MHQVDITIEICNRETFAHSSILLLFCGEVVFLYVEPKTKAKESVSLHKGFSCFCKIAKS